MQAEGGTAQEAGGIVRGIDLLVRLGRAGAELSLVAMMVLITAEVICRSFFRFSLTIVDETCGYLVVAMLFLGAAYSLRAQALLRVEFIIVALPARVRDAVVFVYDVASLGFALILLYQLHRITVSSYDRGMIAPTLMETPIYLPQIVMPVGSALLVLALVAEIIQDVARLSSGRGRRP